jgi:hypothetical protein
VKLVFREPGKLVFRLDGREHDALRAALALRAHLPRRGRPLTGDTPTSDRLRLAQDELAAALKDHRRELTEGIEKLLEDPARCAPQAKGARILTLSNDDANLLLQVLNDVRLGAWETLGCPDFETGDRPQVTEDNFLCLWAMQVTDLFQGTLLAGLRGEDGAPG